MTTGQHYIAGDWRDGDGEFWSSPVVGEPQRFHNGTTALVDAAVAGAHDAFIPFANTPRTERAAFLRAIADALEARRTDITAAAAAESGLPDGRVQGELGRTIGQLNLFATCVEAGDYLESTYTPALPDRSPLPRPDLRLMMRPLGPVVVFGASNFPLAFSTAGGDTASALAAGCPVVVKGHPAHPATSEWVARAIDEAIRTTGMPAGVFSLIQDAGHDVATHLVQHPLVKAVGFTGSLRGGRALFDLCAQRAEPIPFYGELGSINPNFLLPTALAARGNDIAAGWAMSLTMGVGQFCTKPGALFVIDEDAVDRFRSVVGDALSSVETQPMLTDAIAEACRAGVARVADVPGVDQRFGWPSEGRQMTPSLFETTSAVWRAHSILAEEVFGPVGLIVRCTDADDLVSTAAALDGQLTATLHLEDADHTLGARLLPVLEHKAGRILANGFPTGVEVDAAMMHGGPYPASTNASTTSVGTLAIRRFLKPVCYQNLPSALLPADLRD